MIMGEGLDGLDTYKALIRRHPGQKTMITSGFSESERVREAQRLGAGRYLKKPFQLIALARAVKQTLTD